MTIVKRENEKALGVARKVEDAPEKVRRWENDEFDEGEEAETEDAAQKRCCDDNDEKNEGEKRDNKIDLCKKTKQKQKTKDKNKRQRR